VQVLDDSTLAIPDRPGNRRADTLRNLLQNPHIGLLFLVPGQEQTLRVNGTALIARDRWLRERMAVNGRLPELAFVVSVKEVFFHCAKCVVRSHLWDSAAWPSSDGVPTLAEALIAHANLDISATELAASLERDTRERLY
jgi:PPOX class probable FMN-dependent enzyme